MLYSMPTDAPRINRGPAAAAENRRALLGAARSLFAERGYDVALHAIAKEAGVGQGVLYRHFPRRADLALAVFEENMDQIEADCATVEDGSFLRMWWRLVDELFASAAFIEMSIHLRREFVDHTSINRLRRLVERHLTHALSAGEVRPDLTADDVNLGIRMVYGLVSTSTTDADLRGTLQRVTRSWLLKN